MPVYWRGTGAALEHTAGPYVMNQLSSEEYHNLGIAIHHWFNSVDAKRYQGGYDKQGAVIYHESGETWLTITDRWTSNGCNRWSGISYNLTQNQCSGEWTRYTHLHPSSGFRI